MYVPMIYLLSKVSLCRYLPTMFCARPQKRRACLYRTLVLECVPQSLRYTKLWFYLEFLNVSRFLGIVLFAICSQVPGRRLSDDVFASILVA